MPALASPGGWFSVRFSARRGVALEGVPWLAPRPLALCWPRFSFDRCCLSQVSSDARFLIQRASRLPAQRGSLGLEALQICPQLCLGSLATACGEMLN